MQQRFAIAPLNSPNSELLAAALRYRIPSTPQHPFLTNRRDAEDTEKERSHSLNSPNSDRTPPTSQTANCLQQRFAIAPPQLPKQRTACSSASLSHPLKLPKQRSHPLNSPTSFLSHAENAESFAQSRKGAKTQRIASLNIPTSFFNEPRRHEEREGRREEKSDRIFKI
ncbi:MULTISPECIES: hypothetical protein [Nostocales]|uniref:Uncharacterized protein n=1 Tax=Dolichospermum flos-aquae UHCC 0037 TaxID=2590026 RepID=A0ACC7S947_DOLFA|nr:MULTISPECIES: hypothetical protein [Nostocales]MBO1065849.1 hypothetical protein [Anabaena sp. 54]MTJ44711.1 hypothetical protein [Dolichospermum flos-aquae UHCC 0037]